ADQGHLDRVPAQVRRAVPLRLALWDRRRDVCAGGEPVPHLFHSRRGTGEGLLRGDLGPARAARVAEGRARGEAAREISRALMFGVYIHFPYCLSKCPYCDFASRAEAIIPQGRYTEAVLLELRSRQKEFAGRAADSIYFGGGTPSLWDPDQVGRVLAEVRALWAVAPQAEITLEANPGTTDEARFAAFRRLGINRLSIGAQSFAPAQLISLGRKHSSQDAVRAFETARRAGFENVSLDLIHGAEGQTPELAARDAALAVALGPEHISCYALTLTGLAEDVPMAKAARRGDIELPDDEASAEMGEA